MEETITTNNSKTKPLHFIGLVDIHGKEAQKIQLGVYLVVQLVILEQYYFFN